MKRLLLASLLFAAPFAAAAADAPAQADVKTVEACIARNTTAARRCVGTIADACLEKAVSTADQTDCVGREHAVWDAWLNRDYAIVQKSVEGPMKTRLRDIQRQWIALRDVRCAFPGEVAGGGTMWVPLSAYCVMEMTADQQQWLQGMAADAKAAK